MALVQKSTLYICIHIYLRRYIKLWMCRVATGSIRTGARSQMEIGFFKLKTHSICPLDQPPPQFTPTSTPLFPIIQYVRQWPPPPTRQLDWLGHCTKCPTPCSLWQRLLYMRTYKRMRKGLKGIAEAFPPRSVWALIGSLRNLIQPIQGFL